MTRLRVHMEQWDVVCPRRVTSLVLWDRPYVDVRIPFSGLETVGLLHIHVCDAHVALFRPRLAGHCLRQAVRVERRCQLRGDVLGFLVFNLMALHHVDQLPAA